MPTPAPRGDDSTLIVIGREVRAAKDLGREGFSPGDLFIFEEKLFDNTRTERIGRDCVRCEAGVGRTFT